MSTLSIFTTKYSKDSNSSAAIKQQQSTTLLAEWEKKSQETDKTVIFEQESVTKTSLLLVECIALDTSTAASMHQFYLILIFFTYF